MSIDLRINYVTYIYKGNWQWLNDWRSSHPAVLLSHEHHWLHDDELIIALPLSYVNTHWKWISSCRLQCKNPFRTGLSMNRLLVILLKGPHQWAVEEICEGWMVSLFCRHWELVSGFCFWQICHVSLLTLVERFDPSSVRVVHHLFFISSITFCHVSYIIYHYAIYMSFIVMIYVFMNLFKHWVHSDVL